MLVATFGIGATGGHFDDTAGFRDLLFGREPDYADGIADGPDAIRKAVRFQVKNGADVIVIDGDTGEDILGLCLPTGKMDAWSIPSGSGIVRRGAALTGGFDAIQAVALQYRVGTAGNFTNVPAAFVADATTGPNLATLVTPVDVTLPAAVENQAVVQLRIITTDAVGSDEWVGIDDIRVAGSTIPQSTNPTGIGSATPSAVRTRVPTRP